MRATAMRMSHYYLLLALVLVPCLVATVVTGIWHDGSQRHLTLGLFTAILCDSARLGCHFIFFL